MKSRSPASEKRQLCHSGAADGPFIPGQAKMYHGILANMDDGVITCNAEGHITFINRAARRLLGLLPDFWLHHSGWHATWAKRLHTPTKGLQRSPLFRACQGETVQETVLFHNLTSREPRWLRVSARPLFRKNGQPEGGMLVLRDCTEQKTVLENLSRFVMAVEATEDSVLITDPDGRIQYVNPAFRQMTGYSREEALGNTPALLKSGYHSRKFYQNLWRKISSGRSFKGKILNRKKNGELFWCAQTITPIKDEKGAILHYVSVLKDITELLQKQEQDLQLKIAREIQHRFLSKCMRLYDYEIAGITYPASEIGGDFFEIIHSGPDELILAVADVTGHGVSAALVMAETRAYLKAFLQIDSDPASLLARVNHALCAECEARLYVTMLLCRIDLRHHTFVYANAGHISGMLLDKNGQVLTVLESMDIPLGFVPGRVFQNSPEMDLPPGHSMLLLTDGITETGILEDREISLATIAQWIHRDRRQTGYGILEGIYHHTRNASQENTPGDDITALLCRRSSGSSPRPLQRASADGPLQYRITTR